MPPPRGEAYPLGAVAVGFAATVPQPVDFNHLEVRGELGVRLARNFDRLEEEKYQPDHVFLTLKQSGNWPGDTEGRTILGLTMDAQATHRPPKYLAEMLRRLPEKVNEKGYFGDVLQAGIADEQELSGNGWVLRGLCEYYLWKQDPQSLRWINRIIDNLVLPTRGLHSQYPINPKQRVHGGGASGTISRQVGPWLISTDTGCDFIFLDGVVQAYQVTGREELRPLIDEMIQRFLQIDLRAIKAQTHASLTAMRAVLRYYEVTGESSLLNAVVKRFALYRACAMTENYENYNWFDRPEWTEPCAVVDSYLLAIGLWRWTKEPGYLELAENIYYNGLAFEQRANGGFGLQKCSRTDMPFVAVDCDEAHWCCTMRGAEGLARAAQSCFFTDDEGFYAVHFTAANLKASFGSKGCLELREETAYPFENRVRFTVTRASLKDRTALRLFAPEWASKPTVTMNGHPVKVRVKQGFACLRERLQTGDIIEYAFSMRSGARPVEGRASTPGWRKLYYGPLLLGCDAGVEPVLPKSPRIELLPDHTFRVEGCNDAFRTVYHLLDQRVQKEPLYQVRMLFGTGRAFAHGAPPDTKPVTGAARKEAALNSSTKQQP